MSPEFVGGIVAGVAITDIIQQLDELFPFINWPEVFGHQQPIITDPISSIWVNGTISAIQICRQGGQAGDRTPATGPPDSTAVFPKANGGKTIRRFGPDGRAIQDIDYGHDHGAGDPHIHDWDWDKKPPRRPGVTPKL